MNFTNNLSLFYLLIILLPISCSSQKKVMIFDENNQKIEVSKGETFGIKLPSHPGTGFTWQLKGEPDSSYVKLIKQEYRELGDEQLDIPGMDYFEFEALKKGKTAITLWYIRLWKKDNDTNPDIRTEVYEIVIN